jgi:hypothetical protein
MSMVGVEEFYYRYYKQLLGRKIINIGCTEDGFWYFKLDNGLQIEISCDEEGNGPGFLFGLPHPGPAKKGGN